MKSLFSFGGTLSRASFLVRVVPVFLLQHAIIFAVRGSLSRPPWWFWFDPLRSFGSWEPHGPAVWPIIKPSVAIIGMAAVLLVDWLLVSLAFRRARDAQAEQAFAAAVIMPLGQIAAIAYLALRPTARAPSPEVEQGAVQAGQAVLGLLLGAALCVGAVALSTLLLHLYGSALFLASPFVVGIVTGFIANRGERLSVGATCGIVSTSIVLGGSALLLLAFEGIVCILLAAPLAFTAAWVGGMLGRAAASGGARRRRSTVMSVAIVPLLLASEVVLPPRAAFETVESVDTIASPEAVWTAITHMEPIPEPPSAPFRWGLAYPVRGEIMGEGVGAIRRGVFSTGVAYERVTEWVPGERLSFKVLSDPPMMRELSPYAGLSAPHDEGYFRTLDARFTITRLPGGITRLSLATRHELDLEPALYWLPFAQWATHANKLRVLEHFRRQAERPS